MAMELMSPAGSMEGIIAAVRGGADAVYLGTKKFGKQIDYAVKGHYSHVLIMGGSELEAGIVKIKDLATSFMARYAEKYRRKVHKIDLQALQALRLHRWNGNIRELKNSIEKAVIMCDGDTLTLQDLQFSIPLPDSFFSGAAGNELSGRTYQGKSNSGGGTSQQGVSEYNGETLEMQEERTIRAAMEKCGGNLSLVAKTLNISRPTLYSKLKKYDI